MRKLIVQMQMTLDGFVAGPNGELDWMWIGERDDTIYRDVINLADSCDTILLGRKMTPEFVDYWENVMDNQQESEEYPLAQRMVNLSKIVFSRTLSSIKGRNLKVENGDLATVVQALKKGLGKDIMAYGGATFVGSLISLNLVDELYIFRRPVAIGKGLPIFHEQKVFQLANTDTYRNGTMFSKFLPV